jgi:AraC-like DNA-binding protein
MEGPLASFPPKILEDIPSLLKAAFADPHHTDEDLRTLGRRLVAMLAGGSVQTVAPDPRIDALIAWVKKHLEQPIGLGDVASQVGLSPSRVRHLFVQQTGLPFRTFLLWLRLMRAVEMFAEGAALTDAAYAAGFSDSAHLSRTFRRMFGIAAASLRVSDSST